MTLELPVFGSNTDYWSELKAALDDQVEVDQVKKAFDFAEAAHRGQLRESGELYLSHPVWVAKVVAQMGVGQEAIMAALLHDCVEDTSVTIDDISREFGDEVALLVEGLTEVKRATSSIELHSTNIEVFRRFLFSSVDDVRVLIIRLADKLHNGITIGALSQERQNKYARRVLGIYGPVAEYVGLHFFKKRLEDIAFKILYPEESTRLEKTLKERSKEEIKAMTLVKEDLDNILKFNHVDNYEIQSRIKSLYGTFIKTKKYKERGFKDRVGLRIITSNVSDCYTILGLIHSKYKYIEDEFSDFISAPKPNGYRSIQTTFQWKNNITVEVQIRTKEMHEFNEFGPASHIAYKFGKGSSKGVGTEWVKDLVKWQKGNGEINNYRIKVLEKYIYVFTPKGDVIQLPTGSTALDFAYRVHTEIGDHCVGAKINQKMGKIDTELKTGDLIEIVIGKKINVSKNWLELVKTSWAKEHIRKMTIKEEE